MKGRIKEGGKMWQLESKQQDGRLKPYYINNYIGCKWINGVRGVGRPTDVLCPTFWNLEIIF